MNISKNQWIVIGIVGAIAVWYFFLRKKDTNEESGLTSATIKPRPATGPASGGTTGAGRTLSYCVCPAGFLSTSTGWVKNSSGNKVGCYCGNSAE